MKRQSIRVRAAAVFGVAGKILVHRVENRCDGKVWYIPPGGGMEYGETSLETLHREIKEELSWEIKDVSLIGCFESFHRINGIEEHEISFTYAATINDVSPRLEEPVEVIEMNGKKKVFNWVELNSMLSPTTVLYPAGLLAVVLDQYNLRNHEK